jgi:hypothetical protein
MDNSAALHAIQLSVAPVFLLTAIATLIGVLAARLGRIIDRARDLEDRVHAGTIHSEGAAFEELRLARKRGHIVNTALGLLTVAATLIGATVMTLFIGGTTSPKSEVLVPWTFMGGLVSFILALLAFLMETLLATHAFEFRAKRPTPPPAER